MNMKKQKLLKQNLPKQWTALCLSSITIELVAYNEKS